MPISKDAWRIIQKSSIDRHIPVGNRRLRNCLKRDYFDAETRRRRENAEEFGQ
jgi:hypothetical protein